MTSVEVSSKQWRSDSRILEAKLMVFDRRPFATVAAIFDGEDVFVGVARCSPVDSFNAEMGTEISTGRARTQFAIFLGLIPADRAKRIMTLTEERRRYGLPTMAKYSREQFSRIFAIEHSALPLLAAGVAERPRRNKKNATENPMVNTPVPALSPAKSKSPRVGLPKKAVRKPAKKAPTKKPASKSAKKRALKKKT